MLGTIIFTTLVVLVIFFYMRRKAKQNRRRLEDLNSVRDFHASYDRIRTHKNVRDRQNNYQTYVTKYNSTEDYREKR